MFEDKLLPFSFEKNPHVGSKLKSHIKPFPTACYDITIHMGDEPIRKKTKLEWHFFLHVNEKRIED